MRDQGPLIYAGTTTPTHTHTRPQTSPPYAKLFPSRTMNTRVHGGLNIIVLCPPGPEMVSLSGSLSLSPTPRCLYD